VKLTTMELGPLRARAYLVWDDPDAAVLIDPGDEGERLLGWLEEQGVRPAAVLLTHAHFDHVGAVARVVEEFATPVYLHPQALPVYRRAAASAARWGFSIVQPPEAPLRFITGSSLPAGPGFRVLHLPGHCPGHVGFYSAAAGAIFSGDVLFAGGVGRWDIPSADRDTLAASIRKLYELPPETVVYPGHGPATTLKAEMETNPYVREFLGLSS